MLRVELDGAVEELLRQSVLTGVEEDETLEVDGIGVVGIEGEGLVHGEHGLGEDEKGKEKDAGVGRG